MTKSEALFQSRVRELGCICCLLHEGVFSPCEIHHMLSGGRRMGELFVLGLCFLHHRGGRNDAQVVSRGQNQRRFEARYGTEQSLLERTKQLVSGRPTCPVSGAEPCEITGCDVTTCVLEKS